jgi:hypothetical protein
MEETFNGLGLDRERGSEQLKELSRAIRTIVMPGGQHLGGKVK